MSKVIVEISLAELIIVEAGCWAYGDSSNFHKKSKMETKIIIDNRVPVSPHQISKHFKI